MANIIVLFWRDIPAQVIAEQGRGRNRKQAKVELDKRFSIAIDAAAMKSGADSSDDYLSDWRRSDPTNISENLHSEAEKLKSELEAKYSKDKLRTLIANGGFEKNIDSKFIKN